MSKRRASGPPYYDGSKGQVRYPFGYGLSYATFAYRTSRSTTPARTRTTRSRSAST